MSKISSKNINKLNVPQSPVVLAILDGWGYRENMANNAIIPHKTLSPFNESNINYKFLTSSLN